ncbi:hypothetical protein F5Y10DRAFT_289756 [Nemania abortiva]|nr:hypothetical protein F5Y10DRAFT_289756 [Nemania abortiva]
MINSLWIWIVDENTIITATDDYDQENHKSIGKETTGTLLESVLRNVIYEAESTFEGAISVHSVLELILGAATGLFMEKSVAIPYQTSSKGPIEIFRESIRDVANQETTLFREFHKGLGREAPSKQGQPVGRELDGNTRDETTSLNRYHVISSETKLLYLIRDIRDELHMLKSLAEDQEHVWKQAFASHHTGEEARRLEFYTPTEVKKDLNAMLEEADSIEKYINTLLDLRQAEFGRLQASDSAQLSNVILVLTLITIVFLPLSFLSSLFALDVASFPHEGGDLRYPTWWLFPILFGVSTVVSVPAILFAWNVNAILPKLREWKPAKLLTLWERESSDNAEHGDAIVQKSSLKGLRRRLGRATQKDNDDLP